MVQTSDRKASDLTFAPEMEALILAGKKRCTTRRTWHGEVGDVFEVQGKQFRVAEILVGASLEDVGNILYEEEGFTSRLAFSKFWAKCYGSYAPMLPVVVHRFEPVLSSSDQHDSAECADCRGESQGTN
jgi:hypothetical protein